MGYFPPFCVLVYGVFSAVPLFSVWGHFSPFRVLVYGVFSAIPRFRVTPDKRPFDYQTSEHLKHSQRSGTLSSSTSAQVK